MRESLKKGDRKIEKVLHECLGDETFRSRIFFLFLARACERTQDPPFTCERYLREEILALVVLEALRGGWANCAECPGAGESAGTVEDREVDHDRLD
ncbi:hypothetical protein [Methanofollis tationis]|uniref:Uncharacterized protein n=1 Tax=Methanofollis tationis TaxID=81417 RepID=A0A7K4HKL1_9EURY|nr:hypothetical protein [Methanofollis tationis]NVO65814.1 hypothetical protein [Methanofollis tationis]